MTYVHCNTCGELLQHPFDIQLHEADGHEIVTWEEEDES